MEESDKQPTSLKGIIDKNHVLLSAAGVLIALAAFLGSLPISWIAYILSFLMLTGFMLLWSEIKIDLPDNGSAVNLIKIFLFRWFLRLTFFFVVLYILLRYRTLSHYFLVYPLTILFVVIFIKITRQSKWLTNFMKAHGFWPSVVRLVFAGIVMGVSFISAASLAAPANVILDYVAKIK